MRHSAPGRGHFWNANLPHPLTVDTDVAHTFCDLDILPHTYTYRLGPDGYVYQGVIHDRPSQPNRDVAVCFGGRVSITRLGVGTATGHV